MKSYKCPCSKATHTDVRAHAEEASSDDKEESDDAEEKDEPEAEEGGDDEEEEEDEEPEDVSEVAGLFSGRATGRLAARARTTEVTQSSQSGPVASQDRVYFP
jgi:hypothetical protein